MLVNGFQPKMLFSSVDGTGTNIAAAFAPILLLQTLVGCKRMGEEVLKCVDLQKPAAVLTL